MAREPITPAKPATKSVSLRNDGEGSRSFWNADREQVTLRPGEGWKGEILEADHADLSSDFTRDPKTAEETAADAEREAASGRALQERAEELVKGKDLPQLQAMAKDLKITGADDKDAPELAVLIAQAEAAK